MTAVPKPKENPRAAAPRRAPRAQPAPVLAVASGKGGVGKTWLSATLACIFARQSKRTLLVDGDLGLANVDVQLGVRAQADLAAVTRGWVALEDAVAPVLGGVARAGGFDLLAGSSGTGALADPRSEDVALIAEGVGKLALHYDRVVLDLAAGVDPALVRLAKTATRLLVVTTEEPTALADAYALIKVLKTAAPTLTPAVAVNMADKRLSGRRVYDHLAKVCEQHLQVRPALAGIIRRDPRVPDSIRAQIPLPVRHPTSDALDDVMSLVESLSLT